MASLFSKVKFLSVLALNGLEWVIIANFMAFVKPLLGYGDLTVFSKWWSSAIWHLINLTV